MARREGPFSETQLLPFADRTIFTRRIIPSPELARPPYAKPSGKRSGLLATIDMAAETKAAEQSVSCSESAVA